MVHQSVMSSVVGSKTWRAPTSEQWQARRAAMFLRDMNERVEEAEIFQMEMRNIVAWSQSEALRMQDVALENRTRWQYDMADRNASLQFRQSMMALMGSQLGFSPESILRMQQVNAGRNPYLPYGLPGPTPVPGVPAGAAPMPMNPMMPGLPGMGGMPIAMPPMPPIMPANLPPLGPGMMGMGSTNAYMLPPTMPIF